MSQLRKVFITVKTYPTLSKKYNELVCTAGILDDGSWVRIYPLPFRKLDYENSFHHAEEAEPGIASWYDIGTLETGDCRELPSLEPK